jgi:sugar (pentulose or hexulose) kinase
LHEVFRRKEYDIKAINFTSYGASFVYIDEAGRPLAPLYNYLKEYPRDIQDDLYTCYGGIKQFSLDTASPALGSLNSGLQLLRMKQQKPDIFEQIKYALHLPQYLSFLISGKVCTDMTSIGCHTALWDFNQQHYHAWVKALGIEDKFAPIRDGDEVFDSTFLGSEFKVGIGLHDSSSALIPYLLNFHEPFVLISTGTWCISLNPFNDSPLTEDELQQDCLFYLSYTGAPVKASRLFAGYEHEAQSKRIADYFNVSSAKFKSIRIDWRIIDRLEKEDMPSELQAFSAIDLAIYSDYTTAYHALILFLVKAQLESTGLVMQGQAVRRVFVDGGFSRNDIYMNLLARSLPNVEVYAASMAQATAIGAALVIHDYWNSQTIPSDIIELRYYRG